MNKIILSGRLTKDPEIRYTEKGESQEQRCVARYTLAVDRKYKKEGENNTDFLSCVSFENNAKVAEKYLKKGMKVIVEGRVQTGSYTNKDGKKVYTTDVVVESMEFTEKKSNETKEEQVVEPDEEFLSSDDSEFPF
ncbi:single-strand binding protein [Eubacterium uniforme]|uniref:Single-stranded DNA-binding protein n=1 Tax=Eubacterium uniforme TaxID=39495 RepID=A0A1T4W7R7_9FIRM|nr:single-stranded DNA-binding protein [Eubacterium uniforme]SKA73159.1 single-strand binding protein [Eubacterium uniforme]